MTIHLPKPTDAELEILQVLWQHGPITVRFVNEEQNRKRPVGYTTTLKIMQIMTEKKMLLRDTRGRSHVYRAAYQEQETKKLLLDRFLETTFGGSAMKLVMQALGNRRTSREELDRIRAYLDTLEGEGQ